jgi:hypothetical protein
MIRIDDQIWDEWKQRSDQEPEWVLHMLLAAAGEPEATSVAVREALEGIASLYAERGDTLSPGDWASMRVDEGVLLQVVECDDFAAVLPALAAELDRRGIEGALSVWERPVAVEPPRVASLFACRATVRGTREHESPGRYRLNPARDAHAEVLRAAVAWCQSLPRAGGYSLAYRGLVPVPVGPDEPITDRLAQAFGNNEHASFAAFALTDFRIVYARPNSGRITLVGGAKPTTLEELVTLLRLHAPMLSYGSIWRGWNVYQALEDVTLPRDWPARPDHVPRGHRNTRAAFDDLFAPDAFGVQLLGPGYTGRVPRSPNWRREDVDTATLLEHADRDAWFSAPFVPFDDYHEHEAPAVLAAARTELAPILYTPGVLGAMGFEENI